MDLPLQGAPPAVCWALEAALMLPSPLSPLAASPQSTLSNGSLCSSTNTDDDRMLVIFSNHDVNVTVAGQQLRGVACAEGGSATPTPEVGGACCIPLPAVPYYVLIHYYYVVLRLRLRQTPDALLPL